MTEFIDVPSLADRCARWGVDPSRLPNHVAIIMDGNGRWASERGEERVYGHVHGVKSVREAVEGALELGIPCLTLYAFSTENWGRPKSEINALMDLLVNTLVKEVDDLAHKSVRLRTIGDVNALPESCRNQLQLAEERTADKESLQLVLALSYSSKWEMVEAIRNIIRAEVAPEDVTADMIDAHLCTADLPDPELMIRTSGEHRISNFMLWQLAYAEFHFTPVLWPDFKKDHFIGAVLDYQNRNRRFGKVDDTEQTVKKG